MMEQEESVMERVHSIHGVIIDNEPSLDSCLNLVEAEPVEPVKESGGNSTLDSTGDSVSGACYVEVVSSAMDKSKVSLEFAKEKWNMLPLRLLCARQSSRGDLYLNLLNEARMLMQDVLKTPDLERIFEKSTGAASDSDSGSNHSEDEALKEELKSTYQFHYHNNNNDIYNIIYTLIKQNSPSIVFSKSLIDNSTPESFKSVRANCSPGFHLNANKQLDQSNTKSDLQHGDDESNKRRESQYRIFRNLKDKEKKDKTSLGIPHDRIQIGSNTDDQLHGNQLTGGDNQTTITRSRRPSPQPQSNPSTHPSTHSSSAHHSKSDLQHGDHESNQRRESQYGICLDHKDIKEKKDTTSLEIPHKRVQIGSNTDNRSHDNQLTSEDEEINRQPSPQPPSNPSTHPSTHSPSAAAAAVAGGASAEVSAISFHQNCKLFNSKNTSSLDHTHHSVYSAAAAGDCLPFTKTFTNNFSECPTSGLQVEEEKEGSVEVFTNSLADPQSTVPSDLNTVPAPVLHSPSNECCTVIMAASKYSRSLLPIGSRVSCPSRVSSVWSGAGATRGLTVVYGGEEFTAVQSSSPRPHLETWSSLHHDNIQELSAVLGDCPLHRETTYLLTPKRPSECVRSLKEIMFSTSSIISRLSSSVNNKEKDLVLKNVKSVLLEVLSGLSFLHSQGLVHRQLSMQNILLDMRCGCGDVFLCPHKGRDSYRVYLADLSKVASEEEGGLSQQDDVTFFGWMLERLMFGLDTAVENQLQVVEKECPELKGLYKVYLSCVRTSSDELATVQKLVEDLGHLDTTILPPSPTKDDMQTTISSPRSTGGVVPIPPPPPLIGGGVYSAQEETAQENGKESNAKMIVGRLSSLPKDAVVPTGGDKVQAVVKPFYIGQSVLVGFSSVAVPPVPAHEGSEGSNNRIAAVSDQKMNQKETARGRSTLEADEYIAQLYEQMKDKMEPPPPEGKIIFSTCAEFTEGSMLPLPSAAAMADTIGKGGNGVVSYVYHMGKEFAVKETCLREEELRTLSKLSGKASRNVLPISAVMEGPPLDRYHGRRACYQLMPRATGDVRQMLDRSGNPTLCHYFFKYKPEPAKSSCVLANTRVVLRQALRGLQHLHSKGIVHRDVKLQNILLDMRCGCGDVFLCPHEGRGSYRAYLADFDSALDVERARGKLEERARKGSVLRFTPYGTQGYRAPETSFFYCSNQVLSPEPLSLATRMVLGSALTPYLNPAQDLWSFGCTVLKLFVGATGPTSQKEVASVLLADCLRRSTQSSSRYQHSVHGRLTVDDEEMKKLLKVSSVKKYFPLAVELQDLIRQCLQVDFHLRRSAEQCADLPFFKPIDLATDKKSYPSEARQNTPAVELPYPTPRVAGEETYSHQRDGNNINDVKKGNSR